MSEGETRAQVVLEAAWSVAEHPLEAWPFTERVSEQLATLAKAAITKQHRLEGLNRTLFSYSYGGWKSKITESAK